MRQRISNVIGFDDAPFSRDHRGDVLVVGTVYAGPRLEGILTGKVRRDGVNSTATIVRIVRNSRFGAQLQVVLTQGVAFAGFNVIDLRTVHESLSLPVIAVARKAPDLKAIEHALLTRVPGGARKWRLIQSLPPMRPVAGVHAQWLGLSAAHTEALLKRLATNGLMPEPLRTAHLVGAAVVTGESRHRV